MLPSERPNHDPSTLSETLNQVRAPPNRSQPHLVPEPLIEQARLSKKRLSCSSGRDYSGL